MTADQAGKLQAVDNLLARYRAFNPPADFVLVCGDRSWDVHKAILALHSEVLERSSSGAFKVGHRKSYAQRVIQLTLRIQEANEARLEFREDPEFAIEAMVHYMYNFDYTLPDPAANRQSVSAYAFHVHMCIIADKWSIGTLKTFAVKNFTFVLDCESCPTEDIVDAALLAYNAMAATSQIREAMVSHIAEHRLLCLEKEDSELEQAMIACPQFAVDLAKFQAAMLAQRWQKTSTTERRFKCGNCHQTMVVNIIVGTNYTCFSCGRCRSGKDWIGEIDRDDA